MLLFGKTAGPGLHPTRSPLTLICTICRWPFICALCSLLYQLCLFTNPLLSPCCPSDHRWFTFAANKETVQTRRSSSPALTIFLVSSWTHGGFSVTIFVSCRLRLNLISALCINVKRWISCFHGGTISLPFFNFAFTKWGSPLVFLFARACFSQSECY